MTDALHPGRHQDIDVELFTGVPGASFDRSELGETQPLVAMPHVDSNGNSRYDFVATNGEQDGPYTRDDQAVVDLGFVEVS